MDENALLIAFARPLERSRAMRGLAQGVGAEDALLFVRDPLLDILLPAPGLLQSLPSAQWRQFLTDTEQVDTRVIRSLAYPSRDTERQVIGIRGDDGSVLALIGPGSLNESALQRLVSFIPLLAAAPRQEMLASSLRQRAVSATENAERAQKLAQGLDEARLELQAAYNNLHVTERALADERERLSVTLHSIADAVISTDTRGQITFMNDAAERCTGWSRKEALGRPITQVFRIIDEHTRLDREDPVAFVLQSRAAADLADHTLLVRRDGVELDIADSAAPIHTLRGEMIGVVLVFRDITEKRRIEDELIKTQRLESIGILAGGIAHDFNNILTAVLGYVGLAKLYGAELPKIGEVLHESENAILRARELTRKLLTFAKGGAPVRKKGLLSEPLAESLKLIAANGQAVALHVAADLWPSEFDNGQMSQVFTNLILNAQESAGPRKSALEPARVRIYAYNETDPQGVAALGRNPGRYVHVRVEDDGRGVSDEVLPHIFEPFFTTKGSGTGLGLATSYSIIRRHEGYIYAENSRKGGAVFHVLLPVARAPDRVDVSLQHANHANKDCGDSPF